MMDKVKSIFSDAAARSVCEPGPGGGALPLDAVPTLWLGEISDGAGVPLLHAVSVLWLVEMPDTRKNV